MKHLSRLNFTMAMLEVVDADPEAWPVLLDHNGNISEGVGANFFLVTDGVLRTPTDFAVLQGISRDTVIELARNLGIPVVEEDLQPYDAYNADEVFMAGTSHSMLPISKVDWRPSAGRVSWSDLQADHGRLERGCRHGHRRAGPRHVPSPSRVTQPPLLLGEGWGEGKGNPSPF